MSIIGTVAAIAGGAVALTAAGSAAIANIFFKKIIPRQDGVKVNLDEMADMAKWEEYKKLIGPNKEYMMSLPVENIKIKARDNISLCGDYYPAEESSDKIVICFHGYTSSRMSNCSFAAFMHKQGYDCLLVDNRAHGDSEGDYIGFGILDRYDCISWIDYVNKRFDGNKKILLYGVSMGASTVLMASGTEGFSDNVKCIISDCAFTSPYDVFSHIMKRDYHMAEFPVMNINDMICKKKAGYGFKDYSTLDAVKSASCPMLFIHGAEDDFVPVWMSQKNYEQCSAPKDLLIVENAAHGASFYENSELYQEKVLEFLKSNNIK